MHWVVGEQLVNVRIDFLITYVTRFRNELEVEIVRHIVNAVPPGIVGTHHSRPHTGPATFMMPEFPILPLEIIGEGGLILQKPLALHHLDDVGGGPGEFIIVQFHQRIILEIMSVHEALLMAVQTDILHRLSLQSGIVFVFGDWWPQGPGDAVAHVVGNLLVGGCRHMTGGTGRRLEIILADDPLIFVQVQPVFVAIIGDAVL